MMIQSKDKELEEKEEKERANSKKAIRQLIRAAKERRQREEAAKKREDKGKRISNEKCGLNRAEEEQVSSDDIQLDGSSSADYGNFHNYYKFNPSIQRTKLIPTQFFLSLAQHQQQKQKQNRDSSTSSTSSLSFISPYSSSYPPVLLSSLVPSISLPLSNERISIFLLDLGCNEGDLTLAIVDRMVDEYNSNWKTGDSYTGVDIFVLAVDIDPLLIERARAKNQDKYSFLLSSHSAEDIPHVRAQVAFFVADLSAPETFDLLTVNYLPHGVTYTCVFAFSLLMWLDLHTPQGSDWLQLFIVHLALYTDNFLIEYQPIRCYHNAVERRRRAGKKDFVGWCPGAQRQSMRERILQWLLRLNWEENPVALATSKNLANERRSERIKGDGMEERVENATVMGVTSWGRDLVWLIKCCQLRPSSNKVGSDLVGVEPNPGPPGHPPLSLHMQSHTPEKIYSPSKNKSTWHRFSLHSIFSLTLLAIFLLASGISCIFLLLNSIIVIWRNSEAGGSTKQQIWHVLGISDSLSFTNPLPGSRDISTPAVRPLLYSSPNLPSASPVRPSSSSSQSSGVFSSHHCIGDRGRLNTIGERSCHFQNLCLRYGLDGSHQWEYWQDPAKRSFPFLLDEGRIINELPHEWINLRSMGREQDAKYWGPTVKESNNGIPKEFFVNQQEKEISGTNAKDESETPSSSDLILFYHPHYPSNLGHILGDDLFPLFQLMASYNLLVDNPFLLVSRTCEEIFLNDDGWKRDKCKELMVTLPRGLTRHPIVFLSGLNATMDLGFSPSSDFTICYSHVLAGLPPFGFQQSWGKAPMWQAYRQHYLQHFDLSPSYTPKKQKVVLSLKEGRRDIANAGLVLGHLTMEFPDVEIVAVNIWKNSNGWKNELKFLSDVTVLITPCGGVSMSSMFLPVGAALIVVDYWNVAANKSVGMEEKLWSNLGYVRPFHYPFVKEEVELEPGLNRDGHYDMREFGRVRVDGPRMAILVKAALKHVEEFMHMGQE